MACIRVVLALSLTRINALSTTAGPTKTLFLAKPTVNAEALLQHFAAHGCGVTDVDAHTRFAFVQFASDADANRALALENGPYREAKRAHASINDRNATAAAAWDALCAKLRDVTAGAVVPRSHADRVAARLAARGHETLAVEQVGVERLLLLRTRDPAAFAAETSADAVLAGVCVPLALDGHKPVADAAAAADEIDALLRAASAGASTRVRVRTSPPALAADITRRLEGATAYALAPGQADLEAHVAVVDRAYVCGVVAAPNREQARRKQVASRAYFKLEEALDLAGVEDLGGKRALDLGAAPGGWTECLLDRGASVVAVDPGALDESVGVRPGVRHIQKKSQAARADGDLEGERFDAFVCDMCLHEPGDAVAALEACAPHLKPGALVVLAIKLTQPAKSTALNDKRAEPYVERLRPLLDDAAAHHLVASRTRERTVVGRWRGS